MKSFLLIFFVLVVVGLVIYFKMYNVEGYSNYTLETAMGNVQTDILVQDTYPSIGKNELSNDTSNDSWWHYPTFQLGSYSQITNNIKYPDNPDIGTCMPLSMCGALYHDKKTGSNYITPLPPVDPESGTRVGYFSTIVNLVDSLPYRTNMANILY